MNDRLKEIVKEAVQTTTISRITWDERVALAALYKAQTGEVVDVLCNACIMKICFTLKDMFNGKRNRKG